MRRTRPRREQRTAARCSRCRKATYRSEEIAATVARRCSAARAVVLRCYVCPFGAGWHLTRRP